MPRNLAAQFLTVVGDRAVAIDRLQPVAALLTPGGTVLDVVSWADRRHPPADYVWPNRRVAATGDGVVVQDLPDERPVGLVVRDSRLVRVDDVADIGGAWRYPRLFRAAPHDSDGWTFGGQRIANRLECWIERDGDRWPAGDGSVVARAATPRWALAAIRRAPMRPWVFSPEHELVALAVGPGGPAVVPPILVDAHCWPPLGGREEALAAYLPWSENLARVVGDHGGRDVRLVVRGSAADIVFRLGDHEHVLHDEPLDELGRPVGLHFWDIGIDDWTGLREMTLTALRAWFDDPERHLTP